MNAEEPRKYPMKKVPKARSTRMRGGDQIWLRSKEALGETMAD
jgi:hypothetical protein